MVLDDDAASNGSVESSGVPDELNSNVNAEDAAEEINVATFEELRLSKGTTIAMQKAWTKFVASFDSTDSCGLCLYRTVFDSVPSLRSLFKTPQVIQAARFYDEFQNLVDNVHKAKELKQMAESLAFRHLNFEVTVPRAMIFRDALSDCLKIELGDALTEEARLGFMALFGWIGGASIYVKTYFAERLKILRESWAKVNSDKKKEEAERLAAKEAEEAAPQEAAVADDEVDLEGFLDEEDLGSPFSQMTAKKTEKEQNDKGCCARLCRRASGGQNNKALSRAATSTIKERVLSKKNTAETHGGDRTPGGPTTNSMVVPMTFSDMFRFNAQVMGFGAGGWMDQILNSFGDIVVNAADSVRLHEECDLLSLRIDKVTKGPAPNLSQFKSCMLASLRSLLPKEWDTQYEVAWNWLWDNVAQLLVKTLGASIQWEVAVVKLFASLVEDRRYKLRAAIYDRFFESTPAGQEYFKQSDTRLHFIVEKVFSFSQDIYSDPWQIIDDLSALGLRHVGYGVPTEMFAPFVCACVDVIREATDDAIALEGFKWSLGIVSKQLVRTVAEGSTIVMKAVNANSKKMLQRAISCAPRGQRFQWLLKVQVGTQSISPLYWAIQSGNLAAAEAIIQDLLVFRADRERYYYGNDALFERHQDIINCLCREAPMLIPVLLDGLIWRSPRTEKGLRRVNYYVKHLIVNQEGDPAEFLREICSTKDPKIMVHPVVVTVSDVLWNGVVRNHFLLSRLWFLVSLLVFMLSECILPKEPALEGLFGVRVAVFFGRTFMYVVTMARLFIRLTWKGCKDLRRGKYKKILRCIPLPKSLHNAMALGNLALAVLLLLMFCYEPMYHCLASAPQEWPTYYCDDVEDLRWSYSALGLLAMAVHWFLMVDLAVFSTGLSAFVLVCAQVLSEIGRFLVALVFLLLTFGSAISVLEHPYFEMRDIPSSVLCLFSITILLYEDDYRTLMEEPALLTAVLLFVLASSILLMNLLIAQLNSSYVYIYQDMVGFARLNRAQKIVEALANFNRRHFAIFVASLGLDQPVEFNQGDVGVAGGLQLTEPAGKNVVLQDSILRFGGSCSMELEWPEETKRSEDKDQLGKVESLAKKLLRKVTQEAKIRQRGGGSNLGSGRQGSKEASESHHGSSVSGVED